MLETDGRRVVDEIAKEIRRVLVPLTVFSICINLFSLVIPIYMLQIYDRVLPSRNLTTLLLLSLVAAAVLLIACLLTNYRARVATRMGINISHRLVRPAFDLMLKARLANETADDQLHRHLDEIREFFVGGGVARLLDIPWTPVFLLVLLAIHPLLGAIAAAGAFMLLVIDWLVDKGKRARHESSVVTRVSADQLLKAGLQKAAEIWSMDLRSKTGMTWHREHEKVLTARAESADFLSTHNSFRQLIQNGAQMSMLGAGAFLAVHDLISAGTIVAGSIICGRALSPITGICEAWQQFRSVRSAFAKMRSDAGREQFRDTQNNLVLPRNLTASPNLEFRTSRLSVDLGDGNETGIDPLDITLERGQGLAILGPPSTFKSRLVETLIGARRPGQGKVHLDKLSLHEVGTEMLTTLIGYASPDVTFYEGSFGENVACFREIDQRALDQVIELVGLKDVLAQLPDGYRTPMTAVARIMSRTQLQLVALARALYCDPPLLVLDRIDTDLKPCSLEMVSGIIQRCRTLGQIMIVVTGRRALMHQLDQALILSADEIVAFCPVERLAEQMAAARR